MLTKKGIYLLICFTILCTSLRAQSYEVLNYNFNGIPNSGINIKTNLPFVNASQMVTLHIEGYDFGTAATISLNISWYIYNDGFYNPVISSAGGYIPEVFLTNNNGLVNIYINEKGYYPRFKITAFAQGMNEQSSWFQGWTTADEPMQGTHVYSLVYKNRFKGITNQGNLYSTGDLGIGTADTKGYKLAVNGKIRTQEIKVENANWPDYVFAKSYQLPTLEETEKHIKANGHLPGIPSAAEVKNNGIDLGEINAKLLQKIEELTLHLIEQNKKFESKISFQEAKLDKQEKEIEALKKINVSRL